MNLQNLSVKRILQIITIGTIMTFAVLVGWLYLMTEDRNVVLCGILIMSVCFFWGILFLYFFQKKLVQFTNNICKTLDNMLEGKEKPQIDFEAETLLSRIHYRIERLYEVIQENRYRVEHEKAELQSLVSDISHQTKTPIANLKMLNDTLLTRTISEEKRLEFLQAAKNQLNKLDFFIQSMIKISRLETGILVMKKKEAPMIDTLAAAINGILAFMEKKQISLSVNCPETLMILHDSRWTGEALCNLLDNAVKYTPENGSIHIKVQEWEMYVKIDITDTGRGISESEQAAIFKRFYREEAVHEEEGIGVGLYLSREIVHMQGGYIKVTSQVGKGSTFSLFLPRK